MNTERIASLLSSGVSPSQVATIIGCSPARISQLKAEDSFKLLLESKRASQAEVSEKEESLMANYNAVEHALLNQMAEMAGVSELRDVTAALRVVGERQEKAKSRLNPVVTMPTTQISVSISLPAHAIENRIISMSSNKEVIAISGHTLSPLASNSVAKLFSSERVGIQNVQSPVITSTEASIIKVNEEAEVSFLNYP